MLRARRWVSLAVFAVVLVVPAAAAAAPPDKRYDVLVLTESRTASETHSSTAAGVNAIKEAGRGGAFKVTEAAQSAGVFTEGSLEKYRAVVFLNTTGDMLSDNEQLAFEHYFRQGGGFVGIHATIAAEPGWPFMDRLLGTRAETGTTGTPLIARESVQETATIKVADRVHDASKSLAERFEVTDSFYNTTSEVRGLQHVLATVDEDTYEEQDATPTRSDDHPVMWCQDLEGGRAFYTGIGHNPTTFSNANVVRNLAGAIKWAAGLSDTTYSDCGATVLANYKQVKISAPPNLNEPIGFDQLPDGRIIQTARAGQVRLHDPEGGTTTVLGNVSQFPQGLYTHSEDGLYGPAVDANFAQNKWVYLYYSPAVVKDVPQSDGTTRTFRSPTGVAGEPQQHPACQAVVCPITAPLTAAGMAAWDPYVGYFQLSRFKFVEAAPGNPAHLDPASEQEIMRVRVNRGACCHVGGDIDFDKAGNLWLVTGDDTPSGGGNSGGFSPFNDMKTNESQTVRVLNATGGTFTLTFNGQTTAPIAFNATAAAVQTALEGLANVEPGDVVATGGPVNTANVTVNFRGQYTQVNVPQMTSDGSGLTGTTPTITHSTTQEGDFFQAPFVDARRSALNTNDLRGKALRIRVNENGSYAIPSGNLFAPGTAGTRPEIYAMGFRNPFRIQVDSKGIAYLTDYSPDSQTPQTHRGPAGTGRVEIVRAPSNYSWPLCYSPNLPYYKWNFNTSTPLDPANPQPFECGNPAKGPDNESRWNTGQTIDPTAAPGRVQTPRVVQPDLWYSYQDNANGIWRGTPCLDGYDGVGAEGFCPQLFPELFTGGVGPHGATTYEFDPANPSETKFPPYYNGATLLGEFTQDTMREVRFDSTNKVLEINPFLNCGAVFSTTFPFECDNPMDLQFGADGNFYLLTYGDGFFAANADAGMYRWEYTKGAQRPRAVVSATPRNGQAPLTVQFSSEGSRDEDVGDSITFAWDFDNNGTVDSTAPNPSFTYTANGVYTARLTVTDSTGRTASASTVITVGNTAPTLTINTPLDGDFFSFAGGTIPVTVTGSDPEDGAIDTPAECARVTVTFVLVHDTHGHAEDSTPMTWDPAASVCRGTLGLDPGDASHGGYLAGGISASFTDNAQGSIPALETTVQHVLQLRRHELEDAQDSSGLSTAAAEGTRAVTAAENGDWVALNNRINLTNMNKEITLRYGSGGGGVAVGQPRAMLEVRQGSSTGAVLTTITLNATGTANNNTYVTQTFPLNFAGSQRLFLVFRPIAGGPTTNLANINWVEFSGPGVTP